MRLVFDPVVSPHCEVLMIPRVSDSKLTCKNDIIGNVMTTVAIHNKRLLDDNRAVDRESTYP